MTAAQCPVCDSSNHQSFWYWEKEDKLIREWAMDAQVHFSICRDCAAIFQNPFVQRDASGDLFPSDWNFGGADEPQAQEPMEWMRQFTGFGREPGKALEIYGEKKRFENYLRQQGWEYKAVKISALATGGQEPSSENFSFNFDAAESLEEGEIFDAVFCFDALGRAQTPSAALKQLYGHLKTGGAIYAETPNPLAAPRFKKLCLTSSEACVYSFHTLVFAMYKAGFQNIASELCASSRILCTKMEEVPSSDPLKLVPKELWGQLLYRFQRNYYWAWTASFLEKYMQQRESQAEFLEKTRQHLHQRPLELHLIRDVCGACLLFAEEIANLQRTIAQDWKQIMVRIFDVFKNDFALYDML